MALIPHYDNAEGGSHDTRFCYMGERRLAMLEAELSAEQSILGVDSHTCLVLDFGGNVLRHGPVDQIRVREPAGNGTVRTRNGKKSMRNACPACASRLVAWSIPPLNVPT